MLDIHLCLKQVQGKVNVGVYQVLGEVLGRFCNGTEKRWALDPPHLHCQRHHDLHWFPPPPIAGGHMQN